MTEPDPTGGVRCPQCWRPGMLLLAPPLPPYWYRCPCCGHAWIDEDTYRELMRAALEEASDG